MSLVTPKSLSNAESLILSFSYTRRDENVQASALSADYIMDITGEIFEKSGGGKNIRLMILGGDNRFFHEKGDRPRLTYMTTLQKVAIASIIREIARKNEFATITSDDDHLQQIGTSLLRGFTG